MSMLRIHPLPAFEDNYIWVLRQEGVDACVVVDPGDETPVIDYLQARGLALAAILITHGHGDHTGGVRELKRQWPTAVVCGPGGEPVPVVERTVAEGNEIDMAPLEGACRVMEVPGHTRGHLAYRLGDALFCGDTLFAGGCGRVFSGTHEQLSDSLRRIAALPPQTLVYCAHEYTLANLGFARWVEPDNPAIRVRQKAEEEKRQQGLPTVPSSLALELETNPFLRTGEAAVIAAAEKWAGRSLQGHREVFRALREWKDRDYD
ncbi:hydroxyacylglutathione hydrolase [Thiolapillus brandeum]|uniref:Hydroxyacylglutathione hydrolase n=2 Tax=Thiolapillus brandeum TaxID=1076588 RepID=A0A7U6JIZ5_9GAMM|nr:hydroxyacylglutathione hydrolase [Thiolapillus brandeum]